MGKILVREAASSAPADTGSGSGEPTLADWSLAALLSLSWQPLDEHRLRLAMNVFRDRLGEPRIPGHGAMLAWARRCEAQGLVVCEKGRAAKGRQEIQDQALLLAWRQGWCPALDEACRTTLGSYGLGLGTYDAWTVRMVLATRSSAAFDQLLASNLASRPAQLAVLLASAAFRPLDPEWLSTLPAPIQAAMGRGLLDRAVLRWESLEPLALWLRSPVVQGLGEPFEGLLEETLLLQGRPEAQNGPGSSLRLEGLRQFLEDHWGEALAAFEEARKDLGSKGGRVPRPCLPGISGWFHALTLLSHGRSGEAEAMARAHAGRKPATGSTRVWNLILDLAASRRGEARMGRQHLPGTLEEGPLECLLDALATSLLDLQAFRRGDLSRFLEALGRLAERSTIPWFQNQVRGLQIRHQGEATGTRFLADLLLGTQPWQSTLKALARIGQGIRAAQAPISSRSGPEGLVSAASEPKRLAWVLGRGRWLGEGRWSWTLEARIQTLVHRGDWTRGQGIPLAKVRAASRSMAFLTPIDRLAIAAVPARPLQTDEQLLRVVHALAGHGALFLKEGSDPIRSLRVRQGRPGLRVEPQKDGLLVSLWPPFEGSAFQAVRDGFDLLTVFAYAQEHLEIAKLLGHHGLKVPHGAGDQVALAIAGFEAPKTGASEATWTSLETIEADPVPELELSPLDRGLKARMRVRPVPKGPPCLPGEGSSRIVLATEGHTCTILRDLELEVRLAGAVVAACPALGPGYTWTLGEPADCLGLLLDLEPLRGSVRILWPQGERFKVPLRSSAGRLHLSLHATGGWFALDGELRLDEDRVVQLQTLLASLAQAQGDFVPLDGSLWLHLECRFRESLQDLQAWAMPQRNGLRLAPAAALVLEDLAREAGSFKAPPAWRAQAAAIRRALAMDPPLPAGLRASLRPYQEDGFRWLARLAEAGLGACLADDMGLGKTLQALALVQHRGSRGPALVVAPTSVVGNWAREAARFAPDLVVKVFGEGDRAGLLEQAGPQDLVLCSYGLLVQEQERFSAKVWNLVILDEAQAIKNPHTQRSRAVMALRAEARLTMSATPVENHLGELWNQFQFLDPGILGSSEHFTRVFAGPIERDQDEPTRQRLKRIIRPFLLRRTKAEVLQELPPLTEIVHEVTLSDQERSFYEALRRDAIADLAGHQGSGDAVHILAALMRLRRACCASCLARPEMDLPSSKLESFLEILEELRENHHRALVFSQFTDHLGLVRRHLEALGVSYQYLDGHTPGARRLKAIDAFNAGEGDLFLISLKAGGTGLNLTAADYVIHLDPWWNPAVEDQASSRAHRLGQQRPVTVYRLVARDTIEARIVELHRTKRSLADRILEGSNLALGAEDLMCLLRI